MELDPTTSLPRFENILFAPVLHYRLETADAVRALFESWQPTCVAVELPGTLAPQLHRAVQRLPELTVVLYLDTQGQPVYLPVEPCDPLVEAARSGFERGLPVHFIDVDVDEFPLYHEPFPDSYAIYRLGLSAVWQAYHAANPNPPKGELDELRERGMAYRLQQLSAAHERVLMVAGMAHVSGLLSKLSEPQAQPLERITREQVQLFNLHPDSAREVMATVPFISAVYERRRRGLPEPLPAPPPRVLQHRSGWRLVSSGKATQDDQARQRASLQLELAGGCGQQPDDAFSPLDRLRVTHALARAAAAAYHEHTGDELPPSALRIWLRYCRNYAMLSGRLLPDLYQLIVGARGVGDDNLAYETWDLGSEWPWQREASDLPTVRMSANEIWLGAHRFALRPRVRTTKRRLHPVQLKDRPTERRPGEWREHFQHGFGICSYPPEDLVVENFGEHLKAKAKHLLSEDDARIEPFSTSLLDGIDIRETLRAWHDGTLYVRELRKIRGEVGSVVVIFDDDELDQRYPWRMTWLGEHNQESDMAFYATDPTGQVVGPGIARCEYGGFVMSYPPGRMMDVWTDRDYLSLRRKSEVLLSAGLDYSEHRHVVYAAAAPPRSSFRTWANRIGRQIVYLPLGALSPVTLRKLRVFHVLSGHDQRDVAKDYIW